MLTGFTAAFSDDRCRETGNSMPKACCCILQRGIEGRGTSNLVPFLFDVCSKMCNSVVESLLLHLRMTDKNLGSQCQLTCALCEKKDRKDLNWDPMSNRHKQQWRSITPWNSRLISNFASNGVRRQVHITELVPTTWQ